VNDQIIEVDGISLVGVTQVFAAQTLKNTSGIVRYELSKLGFLFSCYTLLFMYVLGKNLWRKIKEKPSNLTC